MLKESTNRCRTTYLVEASLPFPGQFILMRKAENRKLWKEKQNFKFFTIYVFYAPNLRVDTQFKRLLNILKEYVWKKTFKIGSKNNVCYFKVIWICSSSFWTERTVSLDEVMFINHCMLAWEKHYDEIPWIGVLANDLVQTANAVRQGKHWVWVLKNIEKTGINCLCLRAQASDIPKIRETESDLPFLLKGTLNCLDDFTELGKLWDFTEGFD